MKKPTKIAIGLMIVLIISVIAVIQITQQRGRVSIIGNALPAFQSVVSRALTYADGVSDSTANLTPQYQNLHVAGMQGNPAEYTAAITSNAMLVNLINHDVVRPLNDLLATHGEGIKSHQQIMVNGQIMAIAFMANAQHLVYRADILAQVGADVPTSYEELLLVAEKIRAAGILQYPVSGAYQAGWNLAQEFINMYIGHGGEFYEVDTANIAINNVQGLATLNMLKAVTAYMHPDYLTHDSNAVAAMWKAGEVALMNFWGSRTGILMDAKSSAPVVHENTKATAPLMVGDSGVPATTLWWDGWALAKNISDEDATATFLAMKHAIAPELLNDETIRQAVWMVDGYQPAPMNQGVFQAINANAVPYPMTAYHGLLHTALGNHLTGFMQGKQSAEQTLQDIEAEYMTAATAKGFIK